MQPTHTLPYFIVRNDRLKWSVSGLFDKDKFIGDVMRVITTEFELPNPIEAVYGSPIVLWNDEFLTSPSAKSEIDETLSAYAKLGVATFLTFSNPALTKKDLDDVSGNYILEKLAEGKNNGVIVTSDILYDYIRSKYPSLKLKPSLLKIASYEGKRDKAFYESLAERFDRVPVFPMDNMDFDLLKSLEPKDKFEIVVNNGCIYGCSLYARCHTKSDDILTFDENKKFVQERCKYYNRQVRLKAGEPNEQALRNQNLTLAEVDELANAGFEHFNLQGRGEPLWAFVYDLTRYVLEPDFAAPLVFKIML